MNLWRWLVMGATLLFLGGFVACAFWSVCVLQCSDAVLRNAYIASSLPVAGTFILVIAPLVALRRARLERRASRSRR